MLDAERVADKIDIYKNNRKRPSIRSSKARYKTKQGQRIYIEMDKNGYDIEISFMIFDAVCALAGYRTYRHVDLAIHIMNHYPFELTNEP